MPSARIVLKAQIFILAVACAAAGLAAHGGRWSAHLDVLAHFAPHYLVVGGLMMIIATFRPPGTTRLALAVLGGVAAIAAMALILPELIRPASPRAPADAPGQLKLIQYNAGHMTTGLDPALRWLATENPDILVVEESSPTLRDAIRRRMTRHMTCGRTCDVAIFSRTAPLEIERPHRGFYGLGPAIAVTRFAGADGGFVVAGVHFGWPTEVATHRENSRRMLEILKDRPRPRLILAGDFNSTPWSFARRRDDAALGLERRTRALFSWPARGAPGFPILPIDHVYAGSGWRTVSVVRGPKLGSDHYPVVAILAPAR